MIISRTPFRVSFVGGGTDLKSYCDHEEGKVLSTSIDKYIYVTVKKQLDIADFKYRISWSKLEFTNNVDDIEHPIVREAIKLMGIKDPLEITTFADVPARTGLGSSSAFAVGLLHALFALEGKMVTKYQLASLAAKIEIDILKRNIGAQDHFAAAYGNVNRFIFHTNGRTSVEPVFYNPEFKEEISKNLLLFYTGITRDASKVLKKQSDNTKEKFETLTQMKDLVDPLSEVFSRGNNPDEVGEILQHNWELKKSITDQISSSEIDEYYEKAKKAGAIGGKLLGAGGGGFLLFYVPQKSHDDVRKALRDLYELRFRFDDSGSRITYYDQVIY